MTTIGPPLSLGLSWHTVPITYLLTGGFFFKTSAIILLVGGSLFQPEKNKETRDLQQYLKLKSSPCLPMLPASLPRVFVFDGYGSVHGAAGIWGCS